MASATLLDNLIVITGRLTDLMEHENEILRGMRPSAIRELQQDKADLANRYESALRAVQKDPAIVKDAAPALRDRLREITDRFHSVMADNERTLRAVRSVSERVMKTIVAAATEQKAAPAYSRTGVMRGVSAGSGGRTMAVTVNKQL